MWPRMATNHEDLAADQMWKLITLARRVGEGRRARRTRRTGQWEESRLGLASLPVVPVAQVKPRNAAEIWNRMPPDMRARLSDNGSTIGGETLSGLADPVHQSSLEQLQKMQEAQAAAAGMAVPDLLRRNRERSRLDRKAELAERKANVTLRAQVGRELYQALKALEAMRQAG